MKNKILIYLIVFLVAFIIFIAGYYLAFLSNKIEVEKDSTTIEQKDLIEMRDGETHAERLETIRENDFLIHGVIESVEHYENYVEILVFIDMRENFEFSPYNFATRIFIINKDSIINIAEKKEGEMPITVLENSTENIDDVFILEEGDLVLVKSGISFAGISYRNNILVEELWKIVE